MSNTSFKQLSKIENFVKETNIYFNKDILAIEQIPDAGVGIVATTDIPRDTIIVKIPKSSIFTSKTCTINNLLTEESIDGIMGIHLAVLYELFVFKESKSHWYDYLSFIFEDCLIEDRKDGFYLPPGYWCSEEKALLKGTLLDCQYDGLKKHKDIITIYKQFITTAYKWKQECDLEIPNILQNENYYHLTEEELDAEVTKEEENLLNSDVRFLKFIEIGYIISSRVFEIDCYHLFGLVCIVDLFNHNSKEDIHFENDYDVCEICGKLECGHMVETDEDSELDSNEEGEEEEQEYEQEDEQEEGESEEKEEESSDESGNENEIPTHHDQNDVCEIRAIHDIQKGQQIFNTYGKFPNAVLLLKYGFVVENNPYDKVSLVQEFNEVVDLISGVEKVDIEKRLKWWKEEGVFLLDEELDDEESDEEEEDGQEESGNDGEEERDEEHDESLDENIEEEGEEENESDIIEDEDDISDDVDIETFWKDKIYIDSTGEASPFLERLCVILAMNNEQFDVKKLQLQPDLLEDIKSTEIKQLLTLSLKMLKKILNKKKLFKIPENLPDLPNIKEIKKMLLIENDIILKCKENFNLQ
ncbi:hypothetical protein ACO0SA_000190 [Hanseniaspora valbyensis]